jgi:uncharacterized membrane protein YdjX (TVP38/TMEM64 family)
MNKLAKSQPQLLITLKHWAPPSMLIVVATWIWWRWGDLLSLRTIADQRELLSHTVGEYYFLALLVYMGGYMLSVSISLPGAALLTICGGFLFGWQIGGLASVLAATSGATLIFLVSRSSFGNFLAERADPWLEHLRAGFSRNAMSYLLFLRLVPVFPFWLVNIVPGLLGMDLRRYVGATLMGIIPGTFIISFLGAGLDNVIAAQEATYTLCTQRQAAAHEALAPNCEFTLDTYALLTKELIIAFVALGLIALVPVFWRRLRNKSGNY